MEDTGQGPAENVPESPPAADVEVEDEEDGGGFSFPAPPLAADACIVPVYPIFGRPPSPSQAEGHDPVTATVRVPLGRLLLEEREFRARQRRDGRSESARAWRDQDDGDGEDDEEEEEGEASAAAGEELEGVPPESYCLWAPGGGGQASAPASPRQCRKSGSTGSVLRWRRISDRLVGRSHSDGKEKFVFLTAAAAGGPEPPPPSPGNKAVEEGGGSDNKVRDSGGAANQLRYYGRGGSGGGSRRRSYLPYKQELVGLFANVSGLRRSYHPF
ncbi:unnamed protein product [Urochloa humidicola]